MREKLKRVLGDLEALKLERCVFVFQK